MDYAAAPAELNYIALEIPVFAVMVGVELALGAWLGIRCYRFHRSITDLSCGLGQQVIGVFISVAVFAGYQLVLHRFALCEFPRSHWASWVVAFLGVDFCYYWYHRSCHRVNVLWAIHAVHHQSEDYNFAVALRQSWFSDFAASLFFWPLPLLGIPMDLFLFMVALLSLYQVWLHTSTVGRLGPVGWIFNTASHHRVHHGRNPRYLDRNHGATLILWDRLFGTFQAEDEPAEYGVVDGFPSRNPIWANIHGFVQIAARSRSARCRLDKWRIWLMPPGWIPPGAEASANAASPEHVPGPPEVNRYVLAHFVLVCVGTMALLLAEKWLAWPLKAGSAAVVLLTLSVWGGLFERRSWAVPLEWLRLLIVLVTGVTIAWREDMPAVAGGIAAGVFFSAACLMKLQRALEHSPEAVRSSR